MIDFLAAFNVDKKLEAEEAQTKAAKHVIDLANEILDLIKEDDILLFLGTKYDARQEANDIKKDAEKNKGMLIEALAKKGFALSVLGKYEYHTNILIKMKNFVCNSFIFFRQ